MMEKGLRKPTNWQDFESLCKKLWGEIWEIQNKIKKNGRLGQEQSGVDVYGIPKNEVAYWGIQCKGKDDYSQAKLSTKEIDEEIIKALTFKPELSVFIIATTANKDSGIEEYIRVKDIESRNNGHFEILLYCWEDIVDLIENNKETFDYYVKEQKYKTKFELKVYLGNFQPDYIITPTFERKINRCALKEKMPIPKEISRADFKKSFATLEKFTFPSHQFSFSKINEALCPFEITMANEGLNVIEDWRVEFTVEGEHKKVIDTVASGLMGIVDIDHLKNKRTSVKKNKITYRPKDNEPLIQKDNRFFKAYIIPLGKSYTIPIKWEILARDYHHSGLVNLIVEPDYEDVVTTIYVETEQELCDDIILSIKEKKNYDDKKEGVTEEDDD